MRTYRLDNIRIILSQPAHIFNVCPIGIIYISHNCKMNSIRTVVFIKNPIHNVKHRLTYIQQSNHSGHASHQTQHRLRKTQFVGLQISYCHHQALPHIHRKTPPHFCKPQPNKPMFSSRQPPRLPRHQQGHRKQSCHPPTVQSVALAGQSSYRA